MKRYGLLTFIVGAAALMAAGCVERQVVYVPAPPPAYAYQAQPPSAPTPVAPGTVVEAQSGPPAPQPEVAPVSPGPAYGWVPGYWSWNGTIWVWVGGRWAPRPWQGAVWVRGHWTHHGHGYVWINGHWH